jgi:hypothetical protein
MTSVTLPGFLSKKQIEMAYGRSFRSLTRDITRALKTGDIDYLQHLKLVTDDNSVQEGKDLTFEMVQALHIDGRRPKWFAEEAWVADWVAQQQSRQSPDRSDVQPDIRSTSKSPPIDLPTSAAANQSVPIEFLQQRIEDQKQQIEILRGQLKIKDDQIRTANQLADQSQQLMKNMQVLMKPVQDRLLGEGSHQRVTADPLTPTTSSLQTKRSSPTTINRKPPRNTKRAPQTSEQKRANAAKANHPAPGRIERWFPTLHAITRKRKQ